MRIPLGHVALVIAIAPSAAPATQCVDGKWTADNGQPSERFGGAVSLFGGQALIGSARGNQGGSRTGTATIFEQSGGQWTQVAELVASDADNLDRFGDAVSLNGSVAAVGAPQNDDSGSESGSAYVFERIVSSWVQTEKLLASDGASFDRFGHSVTAHNGTVLVGAPNADGVVAGSGAVYVFERQVQGWQETAKIVAPDGSNSDGFGFALDFDGEVAVIGAPFDDDTSLNSGSAYVFENTMVGWVLAAKLQASDAAAFDQFGEAVGLDEGTAAIGAPSRDSSTSNEGAVYIYEEVHGNWQQVGTLLAADGEQDDRFGSAVTLEQDLLGIGVAGDDPNGPESGSVRLARRFGSGWQLVLDLTASDGHGRDWFGESLSLDDGDLLVGAVGDDDLGASSGSAYFFPRTDLVPAVSGSYCYCWPTGPCSNEDNEGGCKNFTGAGARLDLCGSGSCAVDDLILNVSQLPTQQFGLLYMGASGAPNVTFGSGQRCVGAGGVGIYRYPLRFSGSDGSFTEGPGIVAFTRASFATGGHIDAGETWYFQGWYRDPLGPCGTFNLSNAVWVTFQP